jgi:hypothetical protein
MGLVKEKEETDISAAPGGRPFLQPVAIAFVALVVAALFFVMAWFDVRRVESTLLNVLEAKGVAIIHGIEHVAEEKLGRFIGIAESRHEARLDPNGLDDVFAAQEILSGELIGLAADLDGKDAAEGPLTPEQLQTMAASESLLATAIVDANGEIIRESGPLPSDSRAKIGSLLKPGKEIAINLFSYEAPYMGYVGVRRKAGEGAIFVFLDRDGIRQWGIRIAVQQAAEEAGVRQGVDYFILTDGQDRVIAQLGESPPSKMDSSESSAAGGRRCRRFNRGAVNILEVAEPLRLRGAVVGLARVGLDTIGVDELLSENRRHIFLSMGLMIGMGLLAMWFLYTNQNRHLRRIQNLRNRLHQTERLSSMGQLAAGVAHEIRNPLNAVCMAVQRIQREYAPQPAENREEFHDLIRAVRQEIRRLDVTIEDFLSLSRAGRLALRPVAVVELLKSILLLVRAEADARGIRIETSWEEPGAVAVMD